MNLGPETTINSTRYTITNLLKIQIKKLLKHFKNVILMTLVVRFQTVVAS